MERLLIEGDGSREKYFQGNPVFIHKPEGTYSILFGTHTIQQDPYDLPKNIDGIFLETGANDYSPNPLATLRDLRESVQYGMVFKAIEEQRIPIFFGDVYVDISPYAKQWNGYSYAMLGFTLLLLTETGGGAFSLRHTFKNLQGRKITRRAFLGILGGWLSTPIVGLMADGSAKREGMAQSRFGQASDLLHPEIVSLRQRVDENFSFWVDALRETTLAHKQEWLMRNLNNQPHFTTIIGEGHRNRDDGDGFESRIWQPYEERLRFLRENKPVIPLLGPMLPQSFYKVVQFGFDGSEWKIVKIDEIPELKEIAT